eukprot:Pgem_evm2s19480
MEIYDKLHRAFGSDTIIYRGSQNCNNWGPLSVNKAVFGDVNYNVNFKGTNKRTTGPIHFLETNVNDVDDDGLSYQCKESNAVSHMMIKNSGVDHFKQELLSSSDPESKLYVFYYVDDTFTVAYYELLKHFNTNNLQVFAISEQDIEKAMQRANSVQMNFFQETVNEVLQGFETIKNTLIKGEKEMEIYDKLHRAFGSDTIIYRGSQNCNNWGPLSVNKAIFGNVNYNVNFKGTNKRTTGPIHFLETNVNDIDEEGLSYQCKESDAVSHMMIKNSGVDHFKRKLFSSSDPELKLYVFYYVDDTYTLAYYELLKHFNTNNLQVFAIGEQDIEKAMQNRN